MRWKQIPGQQELIPCAADPSSQTRQPAGEGWEGEIHPGHIVPQIPTHKPINKLEKDGKEKFTLGTLCSLCLGLAGCCDTTGDNISLQTELSCD